MEKTESDLIVEVLDDLSEEQLDKFKHKLSELKKIGYGVIEKKSNVFVASKIISKFTKKGAIPCTADVLRAIGEADKAEELEKESNTCQGASSATGPNRGASAAGMGDPGERAPSPNYELEDGQHFVDKHQVALIERVTLVEPILDRFLEGNFISREAYKNIQVLQTSIAQMRKLLHDVVFPGGKVFKTSSARF
ncbi:hypothetical protein AGOR_G00194090 [Albula goreensis]|uniref:Uncharacterized protein n=1 Tax=Albula goreensis TaxID=1534307 RepID=A0A8T3CVM1_9TELE|nr:hypothetical protein AGOR_G00194090 [Albula goreensis]